MKCFVSENEGGCVSEIGSRCLVCLQLCVQSLSSRIFRSIVGCYWLPSRFTSVAAFSRRRGGSDLRSCHFDCPFGDKITRVIVMMTLSERLTLSEELQSVAPSMRGLEQLSVRLSMEDFVGGFFLGDICSIQVNFHVFPPPAR